MAIFHIRRCLNHPLLFRIRRGTLDINHLTPHLQADAYLALRQFNGALVIRQSNRIAHHFG
ncbi:hypothetical protein D3C76_1172500 [compost metagenome]